MTILRLIVDKTEEILNFIIILLCLVLLAVLFIQVLNRYVFSVSWPVLQYIIPFCFVWLSMLGSAVAVRKKMHFEIDFLSAKLRPLGRRIHAVLTLLAVFLGGGIIVWTGIGLAELGLAKMHPATGMPFFYIYASLSIGGILICLLALEQLFNQFSPVDDLIDKVQS
jgi:TRAP-type C4-dicarboxylate transport system permease small subunit